MSDRERGQSGKRLPIPVLTITLIGICWGVFELARGGFHDFVREYLLLSGCTGGQLGGDLTCSPPFVELLRGQVWRLMTPALVHGDIMHFGRNMIGLLWFGGVVERVDGRRPLLMLVLGLQMVTVGVVASFLLSGTLIVGMGISGVVLGLAGYVLTRRWFDESFAGSTAQLTGIYAALMPVGLLVGGGYPSEQMVHLAGYVVGAICGCLQSWRVRSSGAHRPDTLPAGG